MVVPEGRHGSEGNWIRTRERGKIGSLRQLLSPPSQLDPPGDPGGEGQLAG